VRYLAAVLGTHPRDFCRADPGEIVVPGIGLHEGGLVGLATRALTSCAEVREDAALTEASLVAQVAGYAHFLATLGVATAEVAPSYEAEEVAGRMVRVLTGRLARFRPGEVLFLTRAGTLVARPALVPPASPALPQPSTPPLPVPSLRERARTLVRALVTRLR